MIISATLPTLSSSSSSSISSSSSTTYPVSEETHKRKRVILNSSLTTLFYSLMDCRFDGFGVNNYLRSFLPSQTFIALRSTNKRMSKIDVLDFIPYLKHTRELSSLELERYSTLLAKQSLLESGKDILTVKLLRQKRLETLRRCQNLSSFKVNTRKGAVTQEDLIEHLTVLKLEHPDLKRLEILNSIRATTNPLILTDGIMSSLAEFRKLEAFCVRERVKEGDRTWIDTIRIPARKETLINAIKQWPALLHFELTGTPYSLGNELIIALGSHCPRLEILNFRNSDCLDRGIKAITEGCPELTELTLTVLSATEAGLQLIQNCRKLKVLTLVGPPCIPQNGFGSSLVKLELKGVEKVYTIEPLRKSPALKSIYIDGAQLEADTTGLLALAQCPLLHTLRITSSNLSDISLSIIRSLQPRLPDLRHIEISYANTFTAAALKKFRESLPQIKIETNDLDLDEDYL